MNPARRAEGGGRKQKRSTKLAKQWETMLAKQKRDKQVSKTMEGERSAEGGVRGAKPEGEAGGRSRRAEGGVRKQYRATIGDNVSKAEKSQRLANNGRRSEGNRGRAGGDRRAFGGRDHGGRAQGANVKIVVLQCNVISHNPMEIGGAAPKPPLLAAGAPCGPLALAAKAPCGQPECEAGVRSAECGGRSAECEVRKQYRATRLAKQ